MKMQSLCILFVTALLLFSSAAGPAAEAPEGPADEKPCAELLEISGPVEVSTAKGPFAPAKAGMVLNPGDRIKTGRDATAVVSFDAEDKNISRIGAGSDVVIILGTTEKLELVNGDVFSALENLPKGSTFEIRTSTAVAGVRGTDWRVSADAETTDVEAFDNRVYVANIERDGSVSRTTTVLYPGFKSRVLKFKEPTRMERIPAETVKRWEGVKRDVIKQAKEIRTFRKPPERMLRMKPQVSAELAGKKPALVKARPEKFNSAQAGKSALRGSGSSSSPLFSSAAAKKPVVRTAAPKSTTQTRAAQKPVRTSTAAVVQPVVSKPAVQAQKPAVKAAAAKTSAFSLKKQ